MRKKIYTLVLMLLLVFFPATIALSDSTTFLGNNIQDNVYSGPDITADMNPELLYTFDDGAAIRPAMSYNMIVFISGKNILYCFDLTTNKILWKKDDKNYNWRLKPLIYKGNVYLAADQTFLALDMKTGKTIWEKPYIIPDSGDPIVYDSKILVGSKNTYELLSLSPTTGEIIWSLSFPKEMIGWMYTKLRGADTFLTPSIFDNKLVCLIGGFTRALASFDLQTKKLLWIGSDIDRFGKIYIDPYSYSICAVSDDKYCLFDPKTGKKVWDSTGILDGLTQEYPAIKDNNLVLYGQDKNDLIPKIWCLNKNDYTVKWNAACDKTSGFIILNNQVITRKTPSILMSLNLKDGSVLWEKDLYFDVYTSMLQYDHGSLYIFTGGGRLYVMK